MATNQDDWAGLAQHVIERRQQLGMTQEDVRAAGGPSTATMRLLEGALQDSYQSRILTRLEEALRWAPGSVRAILDGGQPTLSGAGKVEGRATMSGRGHRSDTTDDMYTESIRRILDLKLTDDEKSDLVERFTELYRRMQQPPSSGEHAAI